MRGTLWVVRGSVNLVNNNVNPVAFYIYDSIISDPTADRRPKLLYVLVVSTPTGGGESESPIGDLVCDGAAIT